MSNLIRWWVQLQLFVEDEEGATTAESFALWAAVLILLVIVTQVLAGGGLFDLRDQVIQNQVNQWEWRY